MFDIQNYAGFIAAIFVFQIAPGPGTITILNATARSGLGAGFGAVGGTLLGDFIYMVAAVIGLAALMQTYPLAFDLLQWLGAAYLCRIGLKLLGSSASQTSSASAIKNSGWLYFRQAFAVSLTNPKVILFFLAFFPLFLRADASPVTLGIMMVHVTILSFLYQAGLALAGNWVARRLASRPLARRAARWVAGVSIIGFSVKLVANNQ
ncbi:MAG: LysE family translocator [Deltaproteobacteria bacterium]|nr:LysE family translocator [Deltaproteobacteria bacterium]